MQSKTKKMIFGGLAVLLVGAAIFYGYQKKEISVESVDDTKQLSSLREAISLNNLEAVEFLVKKGVNLEKPFDTSEEKQDNGFTALGWAIFSNRPEIAMYLINHGADVKAPVPLGSSMLFWAITYNMEDVAKAIIDQGGDIYPSNGYNPALHARVQGREKIVFWLESKGVKAQDEHSSQKTSQN